MNEIQIESILTYWFTNEKNPADLWNSRLWFFGGDKARAHILQNFAHLFDHVAKSFQSCEGQCPSWASSSKGKIAAIILLDQFPRIVYPHTRSMFKYESIIYSLTKRILEDSTALFDSLPWPHRLFTLISMTHQEDELLVNQAATGLLSLAAQLSQDPAHTSVLVTRVKRLFKNTESLLAAIRRFGRYPNRNDLLGRPNTAEETRYLATQKRLSPVSSPVSTRHERVRVLVLHGHRQNATGFKKATKKVFRSISSLVELVFVNAPHAYTPSEATSRDLQSSDIVGVNSSQNRTFWNMSEADDLSTLHYKGLEESVRLIDEKCRTEGPFQGVMGFSQGGCLAALLALLQSRESGRVSHCRFEFVIVISAFPSRDVREEFRMIGNSGGSDGGDCNDGAVNDGAVIPVPSFHSWGTTDSLMDPARSEALTHHFLSPTICTHPGGHFAGLSQWPVWELEQWLEDVGALQCRGNRLRRESRLDSTGADTALLIGPKDTLEEKIECTFALNTDRLQSTKNKDAAVLRPCGLNHEDLCLHPLWKQLCFLNPLYDRKGITRSSVCAFVDEAWEEFGGMRSYDDLLLLGYCLFPFSSRAHVYESKRDGAQRLETAGEVFYWMWTRVVQHAWSCAESSSLSPASLTLLVNNALRSLRSISGSFGPLIRLVLLVITGSSLRHFPENSLESEYAISCAEPRVEGSVLPEFAEVLQRCVVEVLCAQLLADERALDQLEKEDNEGSTGDGVNEVPEGEDQSAYSANVIKMINFAATDEGHDVCVISDVAKWIPSSKGAVQKRTRLRTLIEEHCYILRYGGTTAADIGTETNADTITFDEARSIYSRVEVKKAVARLKAHLKLTALPDRDALSLMKAQDVAQWKRTAQHSHSSRQYSLLSEEEYQSRVLGPLSRAITHPEPEPVVVSTDEDMAPLYSYLSGLEREGEQVKDAASHVLGANGDLVFKRGALCVDGRLDLCKQVIGPRGVDSLIQSLARDNDRGEGHGRVRHLLLGNNICGDALGVGVAGLIDRRQSGLKTWYIAGNRLSEKGLEPVCESLKNDSQVEQLWLKRNPLGVGGCCVLAKMLVKNTHLMVLDLTNTAIMHDGAVTVLSALGYVPQDVAQKGLEVNAEAGIKVNNSLRHLYLDSNGLQVETANVVAAYLTSPHSKLITLSLACNRLGNEGVSIIAEAMKRNTSVQRLVLASVGVGALGAKSVACMLKENTSLVHLDLGLLKSTAALGEIPNRVGDEGATALAGGLRVNKSLRSLSLLFNNIHQGGMEALKEMLASPSGHMADNKCNSTLTKLVFDQVCIPFNEFTKEGIKLCLRRNYLLLGDHEKDAVEEAVNPSHLRDIVSVYRVNGSYSHD